MAEMITIDLRFRVSLADLWSLWTTPKGIESWWGPPGFAVTVQALDLRPGGKLHYTMTAQAPDRVAFMQGNGMPTATVLQATYDAIEPRKRLTYRNLVDFVPGHAPYETRMRVDLIPEGEAVLMRLTFDQMHDAQWSERQRMGWELELGKLEAVLATL